MSQIQKDLSLIKKKAGFAGLLFLSSIFVLGLFLMSHNWKKEPGLASASQVRVAALETFTTVTSIGSGDATHDGNDIICDGTTLTIDGSHSFNSLALINGCVLRHDGPSNAVVTKMTLAITTTFSVDGISSVNANGVGFQGAPSGCGWTSDGAGGGKVLASCPVPLGPSHGGRGRNAGPSLADSDVYDSVKNPTELGAGGGEWNGSGGNGGGAIIISAATITVNGIISANGVNGAGWQGGAGGTVNLTASGNITGSGLISTNGSLGGNNVPGGGGRIALVGNTVTIGVANISSAPGGNLAAPGTIYIKQTSDGVHPNGVLYVKGTTAIYGTPVLGSLTFDHITVSGGGKMNLQGASTISDAVVVDNGGMMIETVGNTVVNVGQFTIENGGTLTQAGPTTTTQDKINLNVTFTFSLFDTSTVNLNGEGFQGSPSGCGWTSDGAGGGKLLTSCAVPLGPSHGGRGRNAGPGLADSDAYDSIKNPTEIGASGGEWNGSGGSGGGAFILNATDVVVDGTISADAVNGAGWQGGAGGTVNLTASGNITGGGTISTNGSLGGNNVPGGGGRIALVGNTIGIPIANISSLSGGSSAGPGTIYERETSDGVHPDGVLFVKGTTSIYGTPVLGSLVFNKITVSQGGKMNYQGAGTISDTVLLDNGGMMIETSGATAVHAGTFTIQNGGILTQAGPTTTTQDKINLTVDNAFSVLDTSTVNLNGEGFQGSPSGCGWTSDGAGGGKLLTSCAVPLGPSHGGRGRNAGPSLADSDAYDSIKNPTEIGASGGEWNGSGGSGGGAFILNAASVIVDGTISANAVNGAGWQGGAGGTVNLTASGNITGSGIITTNGSLGGNGVPGGGGRVSLTGNTVTLPVANISSAPGGSSAGSGTIYIKQNNDVVHPNGVLYVTGATSINGTPVSTALIFDKITVSGGGKMNLQGGGTISDTVLLDNGGMVIETAGNTAVNVGTFTIQNGGILTQAGPATTTQDKINLNVTNTFSLLDTSTVNVSGEGFKGSPSGCGWTSDGAGGGVLLPSCPVPLGPSHGGRGRNAGPGLADSDAYDSIKNPTEIGASGGEWNGSGGSGGGAFILNAADVVVDGTISADAVNGVGWQGGAGGTVNLTASGTISGSGTISTDGSSGTNGVYGGGGRIALTADTNNFAGVLHAYSGTNGAAGTIYTLQTSTDSQGDLLVDNNNNNSSDLTPASFAGGPTSLTFHNVTANHFGKLLLDTPLTSFTYTGSAQELNNGQIINNIGGGYQNVTVPIVGLTADNVFTAVQTTNGNHHVVVQFKIKDTASGPNTLNTPRYSLNNGGAWTAIPGAALPVGWSNNNGSNYQSNTSFGTATLYTFDIDLDQIPALANVENNQFRAEFIANNGGADSAFGISASGGIIDTKAPVISSQATLQVRAVSGTPLLVIGFCNDANPDTNVAAAERNGAGYGPNAVGPSGTCNPGAISTQVGSLPDGDDFVTKVKITHTDAFGNATVNENTSLPVNLGTVQPLVPQAPTVTQPANVVINPNAGELGNVLYSIRVVDGGTNYVQADGTLGASPILQSRPAWGGNSGINVAGLSTGTSYTFSVIAQNPNGDQIESAYSSDTVFTPASSGGGLPPPNTQQPPNAPTTGQALAASDSSIIYNFSDNGTNETGFTIELNNQVVVQSDQSNIDNLTETGLTPNKQIDNRLPCAFNDFGKNCASIKFARVYTFADQPSQVIFTNVMSDSVTVNVPDMANLSEDESGFTFENVTATVGGSPDTSGWIKQTSYTFDGLSPDTEYSFRVKGRNGDAIETDYTVGTVRTLTNAAPELAGTLTIGVNTGSTLTYSGKQAKEALAASSDIGQYRPTSFGDDEIFSLVRYLSKSINYLLIFAGLLALVAILEVSRSIGGLGRGRLRKLVYIIFNHPETSFKKFTRGRSKVKLASTYIQHKKHHRDLSGSLLAVISLGIVKVGLIIGLFMFGSATTLASSSYLDNGKEVHVGDELTYRLDIQNTGGTTANRVFATLTVPQYASYIPGSLSLNGISQTDGNDTDSGIFSGNQAQFNVSQINAGSSIFVLYRVRVTQQPDQDDEVKEAGTIGYAENPNSIVSNETTNPIKGSNPTPTPPTPNPTPTPPTPNPTPAPQPNPTPPAAPANPPPVAPGTPAPTPGPTPPPVAPSSGGNTNVSTTGNTFNVTYTPAAGSGGSNLVVTGEYQQTFDGGYSFAGVTSEPGTTVYLSIEGQSFNTTSDANGRWGILVSGDLINEIAPAGGKIIARLQAAKNGEASDSVTVAILTPTPVRESIPTIQIPATIGEAAGLITATAHQVEPQTQAGLVAIVPIFTIANPTIAVNLPNIGVFVYHFFNWLATIIGIKKKRKPWGTVYDSITKEPVSLAIIRLFKVSSLAGLAGPGAAADQEISPSAPALVETQVTDSQGRFGFLPRDGTYNIEVTKPGYDYPSKIVQASSDGEFENIYKNQPLKISGSSNSITANVPVDPVNPVEERKSASTRGVFSSLWYNVKKISQKLSLPMLIIGLIFSLVITLADFNAVNIGIFVLYVLFAAFQIIFSPKKQKPWGIVYDAQSLKPVPLAVVNIFDAQYNRLLKTRLTDYEGRFSFLPPVGQYKIIVQKPGYKFPSDKKDLKARQYENNYYGGQIAVTKEKEVVDMDVPVDPAK